MSERLGAADPRLNDPIWMRRAYREHGDMWISLETGAARETVRKRREFLGIESVRPGRRRVTITSNDHPPVESHGPAVGRILARAARIKYPPAPHDALAQFADADRARRDHDRTSEKGAWEELAAVALRIVEHLDAVERAA